MQQKDEGAPGWRTMVGGAIQESNELWTKEALFNMFAKDPQVKPMLPGYGSFNVWFWNT